MDEAPETFDGSDEGPGDARTLSIVQLLPNLVTLLGLCAGLTAIRYGVQGHMEWAAALIVLAAFIDGMDGLLARKLNAASRFGAELDSLSDFVCFGVAPGILVYLAILSEGQGLGWLCALIYILCACLRLARFNVNRDEPVSGPPVFIGVPAPAGAMLGLLPVYATLGGWVDFGALPVLSALYLAFVGMLMISRLQTPSSKALRIPRNQAVWVLMAVAILAGGLATRPWTVLLVADLAYLAVLGRCAWQQRGRLV